LKPTRDTPIFLGSRFNRESLIVNAAAFASGCGVFFLRT
jgi:hypothetical protein